MMAKMVLRMGNTIRVVLSLGLRYGVQVRFVPLEESSCGNNLSTELIESLGRKECSGMEINCNKRVLYVSSTLQPLFPSGEIIY